MYVRSSYTYVCAHMQVCTDRRNYVPTFVATFVRPYTSNRLPEVGDRVLGYKAGRTVAVLASLASARSDGGTALGRTVGQSDYNTILAQNMI